MTVADPVPIVSSLDAIYSPAGVLKNATRWDHLATSFQQRFGTKPDFIARAPGRVNLIGEHIDYVGFSVFPAAIEKDILMATKVTYHASASAGEGEGVQVILHNTTPRFAETRFSSSFASTDNVTLLDSGDERWANYFKVAFKGLYPHLPAHVLAESNSRRPRRIEVLVDGTIPPESSLSSSAAMTTCSSIVVLQAFGARNLIDRKEMAEVAIESERLVGVNSGGMDQSASIFSIPHHALYISFHPTLSVTPTRLPPSEEGHAFVIANTLVVSDKKVTGPVNYNLRVVETRMAARALAKYLALSSARSDACSTLRGVLEAYFTENPSAFQTEVENNSDVAHVLEQYGEEAARIEILRQKNEQLYASHRHALTPKEVETLTGYEGEQAYRSEFLSSFPIRADTFALYDRSNHVLRESLRVLAFAGICNSKSHKDPYPALGELMDGSQASLRDLYNCSCPELNELIALAKQNGALGSRLTGAGWGGCTVHLVPKPKVESFINALREGYYKKNFPHLSQEQVEDACFDTQPAGGACVYKV